ncbi:hypothetical protein [Acinetobacter bereziniae]|uniref:Uncharacterized protein n=1 Tax=Acinetobacter bereziniae NIPH 3 TaxID=1217651 RepID=N8X883_ACIBZ|nr:hypothetical protein [Acinetobacter bereziniae]ENV20436.1 hypothetical protein F963_03483 [Acinetobacter bereziniae NIPH 3]
MIEKTASVMTNQRKGSTQEVKVIRKNRIIVYGGARGGPTCLNN